MNACIEPIVGRYVHVDILGQSHRIHFEESGQGAPLLCLHTAGADRVVQSRPALAGHALLQDLAENVSEAHR